MNKLSLACLAILVVALTACGGGAGGDTMPPAVNTAPVANAGAAQSVSVAATITLNGSASTDADGDQLTYNWTLTSRPSGSAAVLAGATSAAPTFVADVAGTYVASLVVNDGMTNSSAASTVTVTAAVANAAPVANAGVAQNVTTGSVVTLDGSASTDANTDPLTSAWTFTTKPAGSTAALAGATSAAPTFTADLPGTFVVGLVVNDGKVNSTPSTVTVTATAPGTNAAPVANAGAAQSVVTGAVVTLNGSGSSDANGDSLTYAWAFTSKPAGSTATLAGATSAAPTFTADLPGTFVVGLVVNDGQVNSTPSTVTVTATVPVAPGLSLYIYGGPTNSTYLGCLNCNQFDAEAVCNKFGTYGGEFALLSVWNQFGTYGSQYSSSSPWNQFSTTGPLVIGSDGIFYGYFTVNALQFNRTTVPSLVNVLNFFSSTSNLSATRTYACGI